jgi:hypothetical protein
VISRSDRTRGPLAVGLLRRAGAPPSSEAFAAGAQIMAVEHQLFAPFCLALQSFGTSTYWPSGRTLEQWEIDVRRGVRMTFGGR